VSEVPPLIRDARHVPPARDTSGLDPDEALRLYATMARTNAERRAARQPLEGLAYALDAEKYGT